MLNILRYLIWDISHKPGRYAILQSMLKDLPDDGSMNHRWFVNQQINANRTRNSIPTNPLLNPFAWAEIYRAIKEGKLFDKGN